MSVNIRVSGDDAALGKLNGLEKGIQGAALTLALMSGGQLIANAAQDNLKSNGSWITGNLGRSITAVPAGDGKVRVGTNVVYAPRVEYGFDGADSLGRVYHQGPRPYMRPALDENVDAVIREVNDAVRALLGGIL